MKTSVIGLLLRCMRSDEVTRPKNQQVFSLIVISLIAFPSVVDGGETRSYVVIHSPITIMYSNNQTVMIDPNNFRYFPRYLYKQHKLTSTTF